MKNLIYNAYHIIAVITILLLFIIGLTLAMAENTPMTAEQPLLILLLVKGLGLLLTVIAYKGLLKYKILGLLKI